MMELRAQDYAEDVDDGLVADAIAAVGRCALAFPDAAQTCMNALMGFIKSKHGASPGDHFGQHAEVRSLTHARADVVVSSAVLVLKALVTSQAVVAASPLAIVAGLAQRIDEIRHPQARKCVLWLVGQYSADTAAPSVLGAPEGVVSWAPDVLRLTAKSFGQEVVHFASPTDVAANLLQASPVKLEVLTLAAKLAVLSPSHPTLCLLTRYVLELARYDADYDVRDRARMLGALLRGAAPAACGADAGEPRAQAGVVLRREQVRVVLFDGKAPGAPPDVRHGACTRAACRTRLTDAVVALQRTRAGPRSSARSARSRAARCAATTRCRTGSSRARSARCATLPTTRPRLRARSRPASARRASHRPGAARPSC
jgi:AP-3 complex subunit beta